jgi:hypothetical protein
MFSKHEINSKKLFFIYFAQTPLPLKSGIKFYYHNLGPLPVVRQAKTTITTIITTTTLL